MMPPLAGGLCFLVSFSLFDIKFIYLLFCPHDIPQNKIVSANLRSIPNMVKHSLPSMEVLKTYGTEQQIAQIQFPNGLDIVHFEFMHSQFLIGIRRKLAPIEIAFKQNWGGRHGSAVNRGIGISISKLRILFNLITEILPPPPSNSDSPVLEVAILDFAESH